jgi:transposase InsO family protein
VHTLTEPYNPQQNGKCERYWRTLEMAMSPVEVPTLIQEDNATRTSDWERSDEAGALYI